MSRYDRVSPPDDRRRRPRKKRPPSDRDFAIHAAHRAAVRTQAELAQQFQLSQSRISQIIGRVERWLTAHPLAVEPGSRPQRRREIELRLEQERFDSIYRRAVRGFDHMPRTVKSSRTRIGPRGKVSERTLRELAPDAQLLRIALRAANEQTRLSENLPLELVYETPQERFAVACRLLTLLRLEAERAGRVPTGDAEATVAAGLLALLGLEGPSGEDVACDQPEVALADASKSSNLSGDDEAISAVHSGPAATSQVEWPIDFMVMPQV